MLPQPLRLCLPIIAVAALTVTAVPPDVTAADEAKAPYDLEKFRPVLDDSKLQAPTSSPAKINHGEFAGESNEYFYLDETGQYMTFTITGDSKRAELRQMSGDWQTSTPTERRLDARVKVFVPETESLEQFTFMQIHDKQENGVGLNKPLIRITWRSSRGGVEDHLWAGIRVPEDASKPISLENLGTQWIDLGPRPEGFFDAAIVVKDNRMSVTIDGETKLDMDVAYWDGMPNYFKAGVYNQDPGTSMVQFDKLAYGHGTEPQ